MDIYKIESLTTQDMEKLKADGKAEEIIIKEHRCFLVDLSGYFGYSVLVFKNGRHIYYANDYQLHHNGKSAEELKKIYIDKMENLLFAESELMEGVKDYGEFQRKEHYLRDYWIMQFDRISIFGINKDSKEDEERKKSMYYCQNSFCYVPDKAIVKRSDELMENLQKEYRKMRETENGFREMVAYQLANHEAGYTGDYTEGLAALGLYYDNLESWKKSIVREELKKQINCCC